MEWLSGVLPIEPLYGFFELCQRCQVFLAFELLLALTAGEKDFALEG
jgi:hypothetical protein